MVMGELAQETEVLVIGGGPGGYAAAFRAADLGMDVTMVDMASRPGGVCLFRGCIPSKTFLHITELITDTRNADSLGISFGEPDINLNGLRQWKGRVIDKLAEGLVKLSDLRGIQRIRGKAVFESSRRVRIFDSDVSHIKFQHAVIATGSSAISFPDSTFSPESRIMGSAGALELPDIPKTLLVVGGGYVGLELGSIFAILGSRVTLVELGDRLLPGVDPDLIKPLNRRLGALFEDIHLNTRVTEMKEHDDRVAVTLRGKVEKHLQEFDRVLVAIGRKPNIRDIGLEKTAVRLDEKGFVAVDEQQRTADKRIFAVGDVAGEPLLAHKAIREGKVAAEVIAGEPSAFDNRAIPAVVYTDPQIAWCGLTENDAREQKRSIRVERYPWQISSRAMTMNAAEGFTKIIIDSETERILGIGITGRDSEGMIAEGVLAIEMGALVGDMALSLHPHPTLSETLGEAAEIFLGSVTHLLPKQKGK